MSAACVATMFRVQKERTEAALAMQSPALTATALEVHVMAPESHIHIARGVQAVTRLGPNAFSAYGGALNFVEGVRLGASQWGDLPDFISTIYGPVKGFVYFIGIGEQYVTHVKVGFTAGDPERRLAGLQTGCPFKMRLLGFIMGCPIMERELHSVFAEWRCEGEWFVFSDYIANVIEGQINRDYEDAVA